MRSRLGRHGFLFLACAGAVSCGSQGGSGGPSAQGGAGGSVGSGGSSGGTSVGSGGASAGAGGASVGSGGATGVGGSSGANGTGGAAIGGGGGSVDASTGAQGGGSGGPGGGVADSAADAPLDFKCNQVTGLTLTREWYEAGFENGVDNSRWQLKAMEHAYVEEWANPNSTFWSTPIESPCSQGTTSPDRLVFVVLSWVITDQSVWETNVTAAINNFRTNYPSVRRIDLLTVIRGLNNMLCTIPPAAGETIQMPASLDAALAAVAARNPGFVFVGPKFEATSCADFSGGGPHLTIQGNMKAATTIAAYFATH